MWNIHKYLEFLFAFTKREVTTRYKHTVLGFLWVFLNPLIQMVVIGIIISFVFAPPVPNYFLFLFSGLLPWNFFALSLDKATTSIYWNRDLLKKARFPREVLPLSIILSHGFHFVSALGIFFVYVLLVPGFEEFHLVGLSFAILWQTVLLMGLALITSSLEVYYRDVAFFVKALLIVWFYATPVLYPIELIPQRFLPLLALNPLTPIFGLYHQSFFSSPLSFGLILSGMLITLLILLVGVVLFRKISPAFVDWL